YIDNYLSFIDKLKENPAKYEKIIDVEEAKEGCKIMIQEYPSLFMKTYSGDPVLLEEAVSEVRAMLYDIEQERQ
ncbi:MAG TPA: hypothetical protein VNB95_02900, partial [Nitrososphaera sp.]|nr:hypothetical protein [Nitrososphaera sp.]